MRTHAALLGLVVAALLTGCTKSYNDSDIVWLPPSEAVAKLNSPGGIFQRTTRGVFIDPRSPAAYAEGHIPDAVNLPLPDMEENAPGVLAGYDLFVVYDSDFTDVMARAGSKRLMELGYSPVYTVAGGLRTWKKDGYQVATGTSPGLSAPPAPKP
jgi:rhodanese-related sulfurtransferase